MSWDDRRRRGSDSPDAQHGRHGAASRGRYPPAQRERDWSRRAAHDERAAWDGARGDGAHRWEEGPRDGAFGRDGWPAHAPHADARAHLPLPPPPPPPPRVPPQPPLPARAPPHDYKGARDESSAPDGDDWVKRRAHYDRQAHVDSSRAHALRRRAHGPLIAYKKLANGMKRAQVEAVRGAALLIDVGCGRGGDLLKWWDARIERVIATDLSDAELDEARRRAAELHAERCRARRFVGRVEWHCANCAAGDLAERLLRWSGGQACDAVSCQFALQFFFGSRASAHALLDAVWRSLHDGGRFFGIAPDGDAIVRLCEEEGRDGLFQMDEPFGLRVCLLPDARGGDGHGAHAGGDAATPAADAAADADASAPAGDARGAFGRLVTFALDDTVTAGSDDAACTEYVLRPAVLHELAAAVGLEPIAAECGPLIEQARRHGLPELADAQRRVASLYFCFAFRRT